MPLRDQLRVLVVDDMATSRGLMTQALDAMGLRHVRFAADGQSAIVALGREPSHLVISDYNMPGMDGLRLLQALRAEARTKGIGFILISGLAKAEIIQDGRRLGMNNFLRKPYTPQDLRDCIEAVVGRL